MDTQIRPKLKTQPLQENKRLYGQTHRYSHPAACNKCCRSGLKCNVAARESKLGKNRTKKICAQVGSCALRPFPPKQLLQPRAQTDFKAFLFLRDPDEKHHACDLQRKTRVLPTFLLRYITENANCGTKFEALFSQRGTDERTDCTRGGKTPGVTAARAHSFPFSTVEPENARAS